MKQGREQEEGEQGWVEQEEGEQGWVEQGGRVGGSREGRRVHCNCNSFTIRYHRLPGARQSLGAPGDWELTDEELLELRSS